MKDFDKFPDTFPKKEFEEMRAKLNKIPNIGMGGCGVAALTMYRWLKANDYNMHNVRFVMGYSNTSTSFKRNFSSYLNDDELICSCSHMGIIIQDTDFDITIDQSCRWYFDSYQHVHVVSEEYIMGAINGTNWNSDFDRKKYIPIIEKDLGINLSDVIITGHHTE